MSPIRACALTLLLITGCAGPGLLASEPTGKQLERALEEIKKDCIERGAPPFGPGSSRYNDSSCLMFTLKPWEPGDTPESAFAHSIKLPPPHDKPKDVYKPGLSSEAYFKALCEAEAGEWVFRRVEGVKRIFQDRARKDWPVGYSSIAFFTIEPTEIGFLDSWNYLVQPPQGTYESLEVRLSRQQVPGDSASFQMYSRGPEQKAEAIFFVEKNGRTEQVPYIVNRSTTNAATANVGFTWRGIRRRGDAEHGVVGAELLVFQRMPFELLAVRRNFRFYSLDDRRVDKRIVDSQSCSNEKLSATPQRFIQSVLLSVQ